MPTDWSAKARHGSMVLAALFAGACGAPRSEAGATRRNDQPVNASGAAPLAGNRDDMLTIGRHAVKVTVDASQISPGGLRDIKVLARHGRLIALSDSYASKPRGTSLCQAGNETWFRVIDDFAGIERYARLADSCRSGAQWGDPPVTVARGATEVTLNLLSESPVTLTLGDDGRVSASR